jgi:YVTN family beta-propeller protein
MKLRISGLLAIGVFAVACLLGNGQSLAQNAYITNTGSNTGSYSVSVIDTTTNTVIATIPVGTTPFGVAVSPDGSTAYVTNVNSNSVSVIDTASNTVRTTIAAVGVQPFGLASTPDGTRVYVGHGSGLSPISR